MENKINDFYNYTKAMQCCSCKQIKNHDEFRLLYDKRTGLHYKTTRCNKCSVEYTKKYYENNEFYRERAKQRSRDWYHANKDRYNQWRINRKNNTNASGNE